MSGHVLRAARLSIGVSAVAACLVAVGANAASSSAAPGDPYGSGHGLCFDTNSALAADAVNGLGPDPNGGSWNVQGGSENPLSQGCGLDWMQVNGNGINDATYVSRVLLFAGGRYLGTVEPKPYSYTTVTGSTTTSVTVSYRWLNPDDPFCCPQGGPTSVTATLAAGSVQRTGAFPPVG